MIKKLYYFRVEITPTPSDNDNSTKIATTAFVKKFISNQTQLVKKSERTSVGLWTIPNLTVGKPVIVTWDKSTTERPDIRLIGYLSGNITFKNVIPSNGWMIIGILDNLDRGNVFIFIPTASSITLPVNRLYYCSAVAYQ